MVKKKMQQKLVILADGINGKVGKSNGKNY